MKILQAGFDDYRAKVIPANPAENQVLESRRAFMAGALWTLTALERAAHEKGNEVEELCEAMQSELVEFAKNVGRGL